MAEFLTTQGTAYYLENIIMNATQWLVLISPYLNISNNFLLRLQDADKRKVKITIVYGKSELTPNEKRKLQELENLSLFYCDKLHAKCFFNDNYMIITSMNMHEFSEKTNREMGVLIRKEDNTDQKIYEDAMREVKSILDSVKGENEVVPSKVRGIPDTKPYDVKRRLAKSTENGGWVKGGEALVSFLNKLSEKSATSNKSKLGHCIRCNVSIPFDLDRPYCRECFSSWRKWGNPDYLEKFCHNCGNNDRSSMLYPQCYSCFSKSQR